MDERNQLNPLLKLALDLGPLLLFFFANSRPALFEPLLAPIIPEAVAHGERAGIFVATDHAEPATRIDRAFVSACAAEPVERTLREARRRGLLRSSTLEALATEALEDGIIDAAAVALITRMLADQRHAIEVDAFGDYGRQFANEAVPPHGGTDFEASSDAQGGLG